MLADSNHLVRHMASMRWKGTGLWLEILKLFGAFYGVVHYQRGVMILPRMYLLLLCFLVLMPTYKLRANQFVPVGANFQYVNDSLALIIGASGNLISYSLKGKHYQKDFIEDKSAEEDGKKSERFGGIRFGIPQRDTTPFSLISAEIDPNDSKLLHFVLEDKAKDSPGFSLKVIKTWSILAEKNQLSLKVRVENPTDKTIPLFPSSNVNSTIGLLFSVKGGLEYWDTFVAGSGQEIEEVQGDLQETLSPIGTDDPTRVFTAYRNQHFVAGLLFNPSQSLYGSRIPIADSQDAIYSAFLPLGVDFLKAGESIDKNYRFYLGEKTEESMAKTAFAPLFDKYGPILGGIERLLFQTLKLFYSVTLNYGWAILLLTLLVKILLLPLNIKQTRSMAKMQEIQPELKKLQEKFKDDRQKLNAEMMRLYQVNQINPLAGCLPMLLQLPIFFALFYTVGGSVEIYGESFFWIKNLALRDPLDILPLIFVGSFIISQRKMSVDPNQKMLVYVLPIVFFFMMRNLSSGVMLYIVGQSLFSNIEQLIIKGKKTATEGEAKPVNQNGSGRKRSRKKKTKDGWNPKNELSKNKVQEKGA